MSINAKLFALILAFVIVPMGFVGVASVYASRHNLEQARIHELAAIADLKRERIVKFFEDKLDEIHIAQDYYNVKANLPIIAKYAGDRDNPAYIQARDMLNEQLTAWFNTKSEIADLMLVDLEGKIVYSVNPEHEHMDLGRQLPDPGNHAYSYGLERIYITDLFLNAAEYNKPGIIISAPIYDFDHQLIGVIALELDMEAIYSTLQDVTGLGATGETLIGRKAEKEAQFLNPLRHDPTATLNRTVRLGERDAYPMQEAVNGREGEGITIDYRGKEVIAVWRYIPMLDWGFVAKMDTAEAFGPITELRNRTISFGILITLLAIVVTMAIARTIARPLHALEQTVTNIGAGDLAVRSDLASRDEIGRLASGINAMAAKLQLREQHLRKLGHAIEQSPASIIITDASGTIEYVNPRFSDVSGYGHQEAVGRTPRLLKSGNQPPEFYEALWNTITSGEVWNGEILNKRKNGELFWESMSISPIFNEKKEIISYVAVKEDITERKLAEQRLNNLLQQNRRLTERLFEVQETERRHLAQELHDQFGQWLTAVQLHAQVISELTPDKSSKSYRSAEAITQCATQMHQVVRGIIHELRPPILDLGLEAGLQELVSQWQAHNPATACELVIQCDLGQLEEVAKITLYRVVQEGLTNAAKHSQGSTLSIRLYCDQAGHSPPGTLALTIADDGKGLDLSATHEGMGLTGMRERVLVAGGEFSLTSQPGAGTCIEVRLPMASDLGVAS